MNPVGCEVIIRLGEGLVKYVCSSLDLLDTYYVAACAT